MQLVRLLGPEARTDLEDPPVVLHVHPQGRADHRPQEPPPVEVDRETASRAEVGLAHRRGDLLAYAAGSPSSLRLEERLSPALSGIAIFFFIGLTLPVFGLAFRKVRRRLSRA
ncbi:hypothetical protein ACIHCQ_29940 [Streptomyces sp. NPDC052236]|uniref:hypothetical protein n=1 Tax=Streptomyces sp. NPDC052236 TaxID=3365686 RepID=UPI0037D7FC31